MFVGVLAEEGTDNSEENKHQVEGVPTLLHRVRFKNVSGERVQRGNYDQRECKCNHQNAYEKCTGAEKQRVGPAEAAAAPAVFRPERWRHVVFFFHLVLV